MATSTGLMWVEYDGAKGSQNDDYELQAAKRQHVMLNFLHNATKENQPQTAYNKSKKRRIETQNRRHTAKSLIRRQSIYAPEPSMALTCEIDRTVTRAAWWHFYNPYTPENFQPTDWINQCRSDWNGALWAVARDNNILREVFMSFSAAKEGHMSGLDTRKGYLSHKGNAIKLLSRELGCKGDDVNIFAVVTICLLSKAAFAEEEWDVAESHVKAISALVGNKLDQVPGFLWLFIVWADLRLTKVISRAPRLPYGVHKEFQVPISDSMMETARESARLNTKDITVGDAESKENITKIFENLHQLALVYDDKKCDWRAAWTVCYETAYMLAVMRDGEGSQPETDMDLIYISAHLQYCGTVAPFVPQEGLQKRMQKQLMRCLRSHRAADLCERWKNHGALDLLLFALFNTSLSFLAYPTAAPSTGKSALVRLRRCMKLVIREISLENGTVWTDRLKMMPFSRTWNRRYYKVFCDWLETGLAPEMADSSAISAPFGNLRLTFDAVSSVDYD